MNAPWLTDPNWKPRTYDQVLADYNVFTDEQRSLAWSPEPPHERTAGSDCRRGGSCGLDLDEDSPRARWRKARFRFRREEEKALPTKKPAASWARTWQFGDAA